MLTMSDLAGNWGAMATAALAGPLVVAGAAKLLAKAGTVLWPVETGPLRAPAGPRLAGAVECVAAAGLVLLPARPAAVLAVVTYTGLAAVATALRGQKCACFGTARLAAIGRGHIGVNAAAAAVATVAAVTGSSTPGTGVRVGVAVAAGLVMAGTVLILDRREQAAESGEPGCEGTVTTVQLYVGDTCPSCRSLEELLTTTMESARLEAVTTTVLTQDDSLPPELAGLGVPAAVGLGADGRPICRPVDGIGAVKALIDSIVLRAPVGTRAH
jgi:hypothetical protein